jgi:hypothetical protein
VVNKDLMLASPGIGHESMLMSQVPGKLMESGRIGGRTSDSCGHWVELCSGGGFCIDRRYAKLSTQALSHGNTV